jgi:predicted nuclease with TOPRIM domain
MTNDKQDEPDAVYELKKRIAELEEKVKLMENQENGAIFSDSSTDYEISQYLVMAGVGVCAVLGRSILKRLFWSSP